MRHLRSAGAVGLTGSVLSGESQLPAECLSDQGQLLKTIWRVRCVFAP